MELPPITRSINPGSKSPSKKTQKEIMDNVELLKEKGYKVSERLISIDELHEAAKNGTLEEAWGTGTAAVVSPIGWLSYKGEEFVVNNGVIGEVTQALYDELTGIQWGKIEDTHGWCHKVC